MDQPACQHTFIPCLTAVGRDKQRTINILEALDQHPMGITLTSTAHPLYAKELGSALSSCGFNAPTSQEADEAAAAGNTVVLAAVAIWLSRQMDLSVAFTAPLVNLAAQVVPQQQLQHCATAVLQFWRDEQGAQ